jgi:hypothetical protein
MPQQNRNAKSRVKMSETLNDKSISSSKRPPSPKRQANESTSESGKYNAMKGERYLTSFYTTRSAPSSAGSSKNSKSRPMSPPKKEVEQQMPRKKLASFHNTRSATSSAGSSKNSNSPPMSPPKNHPMSPPKKEVEQQMPHKKPMIETTAPPKEGNLPALWVRSMTGAVKLLDRPDAAPSAEFQKPKKTLQSSTDPILFEAFRRQQLEMKGRESKKDRKRGSIFKLSSQDGQGSNPLYFSSNVDDALSNMSMMGMGVKISTDQGSEPSKIKEEDINRTLLAQETEKDKEKRPNKKKDSEVIGSSTSSRKPLMRKKRVQNNHHTRHITHHTYMFHLHHPNLMSSLFDLPIEKTILLGCYDVAYSKYYNQSHLQMA